MSTRLSKAVLSLFTVAAATALTLSPQSAQAMAREDCPRGQICAWQQVGFTGLRTAIRPANCTNTPFRFSSIFNNNGPGRLTTATVYSGTNCTGAVIGTFVAGQSGAALRTPGASVFVSV